MSAEKNNLNSASQKEALSKNSDTVQGDIYVQDVHKYFGVTRALNGVNFSANFGEIHAIVGGNGCGKSTLAKVMSGVLPIDKGKVSVLGHTPTSPVMARNMGIATVFQEVMIAEEASVVDLSLIHISEPTRLGMISYAVFCLKKKYECRKKQFEQRLTKRGAV